MKNRDAQLTAMYEEAAKQPPRKCRGPCGETKPASEFYVERHRGGKKGYLSGRCKVCFRAQVRAKQLAKAGGGGAA